jgi:hypothetical protein
MHNMCRLRQNEIRSLTPRQIQSPSRQEGYGRAS